MKYIEKEKNMCKISVITPVYKVEKYLEKCINSILNQTFSDFELFIVDDGSPDSCGKIADEYAKKDNRVRVIHKENGGAPSARNIGIKEASGDFFYFPDSDDWLEENYLQEMYDLAVKTNAQLVVTGYTMEYYENNSRQSYKVFESEKNYFNQQLVRNNIHNYFDNMMMAVPWNKLYRADYVREHALEFPNLKWDDLHFNMEVIMDIERVAISSSAGYHFFRSRAGSETTTVFDGMLFEKRKEQFEHILKVYQHWGTTDKDVLSVIYGYYASRLVQCVQEIAISGRDDIKERIYEVVNDSLSVKAFSMGQINSKLLRIASIPMKNRNVKGCLVVGKFIGFVKENMASLFYKLKSVSVNKALKV